VKILETGLEREYFTKHGQHLNSSGKECIAQGLARVIRSFLKKGRMSPISLYWKDDTSFSDLNGNNKSHITRCNTMTAPQSQPSTSLKETLRKESQDSDASPNKTNENEVKTAHSQLTKRQRKRPAPRTQDFLWTT
jgi:hypothetical protein